MMMSGPALQGGTNCQPLSSPFCITLNLCCSSNHKLPEYKMHQALALA